MVAETLERSQTKSPAVLQGVLMDAAKAVPETKRTPSFMACLAQKILTVAAHGEQEPARIRAVALERLWESCPRCRACESLHTVKASHRLPSG
jgi:hypothetical protein